MAVRADNAGVVLRVVTDRPEALYTNGEQAVFKVSLLNAVGMPITGKVVKLVIEKRGERAEQALTTADHPVEAGATLDRPGFLLCTATCEYAPKQKLSACAGAGFNPLEIRQSHPAPDDFDRFWAAQKERLANIPMHPRVTPIAPLPEFKEKVEAFNVILDCDGGAPVSGYLARPIGAREKSLPAFIYFHGAGVDSSIRQDKHAVLGALAMDINAHGIENGKPTEYYKELSAGKLAGYYLRGADSVENIYFRGMFLRAIRALEFLKAQPEWDGKTLIVFGSSQGGAQALAAAGLDPQVTFCVAMVPCMCDQLRILDGERSGWPQLVSMKGDKPVNPDVVKTVPYFDAASFAARIKAETFINVGFVDGTCPPTTVYAAYNNIQAPKRITNHPLMGHVYNDEEAEKLVAEHLAVK